MNLKDEKKNLLNKIKISQLLIGWKSKYVVHGNLVLQMLETTIIYFSEIFLFEFSTLISNDLIGTLAKSKLVDSWRILAQKIEMSATKYVIF